MTNLRNLAIIGMMARLNTLIDEGPVVFSPAEVKKCVADGTILDRLRSQCGDFSEFSPLHAEAVSMKKEWKEILDIYSGREETKMGVRNNGLCLLIGYCLEILMQRNLQ